MVTYLHNSKITVAVPAPESFSVQRKKEKRKEKKKNYAQSNVSVVKGVA